MGEKCQCVVASHTPPTGDLARNTSMCPDWESNRQPFGSQAGVQSIEPHQPGPNWKFLTISNKEPHMFTLPWCWDTAFDIHVLDCASQEQPCRLAYCLGTRFTQSFYPSSPYLFFFFLQIRAQFGGLCFWNFPVEHTGRSTPRESTRPHASLTEPWLKRAFQG